MGQLYNVDWSFVICFFWIFKVSEFGVFHSCWVDGRDHVNCVEGWLLLLCVVLVARWVLLMGTVTTMRIMWILVILHLLHLRLVTTRLAFGYRIAGRLRQLWPLNSSGEPGLLPKTGPRLPRKGRLKWVVFCLLLHLAFICVSLLVICYHYSILTLSVCALLQIVTYPVANCKLLQINQFYAAFLPFYLEYTDT